MTTNDDQRQALLERDLYELSRPSEADETLRLALRAELAERARPRITSRLRRRPAARIAFAATAFAAIAAAAAIALIGTGGSGSPDAASAAIIRHTVKAVTPPANTILRMKAVGVDGANVSGEWWQQTSPPYASRGIKGPLGHQGESADDGTTSFAYDSATNTIYERPDSAPPRFVDPLSPRYASARQRAGAGRRDRGDRRPLAQQDRPPTRRHRVLRQGRLPAGVRRRAAAKA